MTLFSTEGMNNLSAGSFEGAGQRALSIEFEVQDVDQEYVRLKSLNVKFVKEPTTQPWGRRSVWFRDPDGNLVNFYANVAKH